MGVDVIYSNLESFEGTVSGTVTLSLTLYSRKLIITNDSGSADLQFYPKTTANANYMTLKPTETIHRCCL
jgi:hypothetical protein